MAPGVKCHRYKHNNPGAALFLRLPRGMLSTPANSAGLNGTRQPTFDSATYTLSPQFSRATMANACIVQVERPRPVFEHRTRPNPDHGVHHDQGCQSPTYNFACSQPKSSSPRWHNRRSSRGIPSKRGPRSSVCTADLAGPGVHRSCCRAQRGICRRRRRRSARR